MPNEEMPPWLERHLNGDTVPGGAAPALEQLLVLITASELQPEMLKLINLQELVEQLEPAIAVLCFGGKVITHAEAAVLDAAADINVRWLESYVNIIVPTQADPQAYAFAQAELARRKQEPSK